MKTFFSTLMTIVLFTSYSLAQTGGWTKDDRNNIYNDCMSYIGKYTNLTTDQKESVSICYLNQVTEQYSKQDYQNKIDVEIRKLRETTLTLCSKSLGIVLSEQKTEEPQIEQPVIEESKATKENLIGDWEDDESTFSLFKTGDFVRSEKEGGKKTKGTWRIEDNMLTLNTDKTLLDQQKEYKILMFMPDQFVCQSVKNKKDTFTVKRIK